jgi:hypothetical protein
VAKNYRLFSRGRFRHQAVMGNLMAFEIEDAKSLKSFDPGEQKEHY